MDKTKFAILVGFLLALLFLCSMDAEASANNTVHSITTGITSYAEKAYKFHVGNDGVISVSDEYGNIVNTISYVSGNTTFSFDTGVLSVISHSTIGDVNNLTLYDKGIITARPDFEVELSYEVLPDIDYFGLTQKSVRPYIVIDGVKSYFTDIGYFNDVSFDILRSNFNAWIGCEVDISVYFEGESVSVSDIATWFGSVNVNVIANQFYYEIYGLTYVSTGDNRIANEIVKSNGWLSDINNFLYSIDYYLKSFRTEFINRISDWQTSMDAKLDEVIQKLSFNYNPEQGNATNSELSSSLDSWEAAEGATMSDAKIDVSNYDTSTVFNFAPALVSSLSLVTTFATGFLRASGDFTTAISVMFSLAFVSVLVGLVRFVRG